MSLRLRRLQASDGARVLAWRNSPQVSAFMYTDEPISEAVHQRWMEGVLDAPDRHYWIVELDGRPVGLANIVKVDLHQSRCEWAYYLADEETRGRGVGSCIAILICRYVFETLGLNKLWGEVLAGNATAQRRLQQSGFTREAVLRDHVRRRDGYHDVLGFGLLSREWSLLAGQADARLQALGYGPAEVTLDDAY